MYSQYIYDSSHTMIPASVITKSGNVTRGTGFVFPNNNTIHTTDSSELDASYTSSFPFKLYQLLSSQENHGAVNWLNHGKSFRVEDPHRFANEIVPHYFKRKYHSI